MKYYPTSHAIDRAVLRFGVSANKASDWIRNKLEGAKYITENNGGSTLIFENDDIRFVIDGKKNTVITLHSATRLDFIRPALEREIRKLKRESTSRIRATEKRMANAYAELAERMMNFANARNPKTRELISERIREKEAQINDLERSIERQKDDLQAKIKAIELIAE